MSMFSIGLSGLNSAQNALNTTSNNISNVYTPGYNREVTKLGEGSASAGGVQVNDIERQFNRYVAEQLNNSKTQSSALAKQAEQISQIDNLLADRDAGLAPLMQNFFASLEDLTSAPSDPASRQGVLGTAQTMSAQFRSFDGYLADMQDNVANEIEDEVLQINNTTEQLAGLNREIALARARSGEAPNSLLNQRDLLVSELNERMDVRLNVQDGKTYNVSLPNGQPLVTGTDSFDLAVIDSSTDPSRQVVGYVDRNGGTVELSENLITGGSLGGLMTFRQETLDKTQNQIGQLAVSFSLAFNEQHQQGVDLEGEQGQDFFAVREPTAFSTQGNGASVSSIVFDRDNLDDLRAADYQLEYEGGDDFAVTNQQTGEEFTASLDNGELAFGGVIMTFSGTLTAGDTFDVQPVRRAAAGMETNINDLDKIAAGQFTFDSTGDLSFSDLRTSGPQAFASAPNGQLQFELDGNGQLTVPGFENQTIMIDGQERAIDVGGVVRNAANDGAEDFSGQTNIEIRLDDVSVVLEDGSETGNVTLEQGIAFSGDNRNALALQNLQSEPVVGGSASISAAYGSIVSDVGNKTNVIQVNLDARQGLTDQLTEVQQSESGVNLDEEAANLIKFQQYYQANARVIDTATTLLDTILGLRN